MVSWLQFFIQITAVKVEIELSNFWFKVVRTIVLKVYTEHSVSQMLFIPGYLSKAQSVCCIWQKSDGCLDRGGVGCC